MSQLVRLEGKHSTQNAHCAVLGKPALTSLPSLSFVVFAAEFILRFLASAAHLLHYAEQTSRY